MAISAVMFFESKGDVRKMYDAVIDDMGVRDNPPAGAVHHWCAPVRSGLRVCDVWESREAFERFAKEKISPIAAKHGFGAPVLEIAPVHEMILGKTAIRKGVGFFVDFEGETESLLEDIDALNVRMNVVAAPPEGLAFHCATPSQRGVRVIDHWRSTDDFERFIDAQLGAALHAVGMPQPKITDFQIYNTIDRRIATRA